MAAREAVGFGCGVSEERQLSHRGSGSGENSRSIGQETLNFCLCSEE